MIVLHASINNPKYRPLFRAFGIDVTKYHPRQDLVGKCLLARLLHVPLQKIVNGELLKYGRFGKPYLKDHALSFNLTNSKNAVILVADRQPVAVDTEAIRSVDYRRIHRAFLPEELRFLAQLPLPQRFKMTLKFWTVKEGVLKQVGTGLNGGVRTVRIHLPVSDDVNQVKRADRLGKRYRLLPYNVTPDYVGTIVKDE